MTPTLNPGTLIVASAYPDPPFDIVESGAESGFDIELMRAICRQLGVTLRPVRYAVNRALAAVRANGEFARLEARWFPANP
jgi:ABC-type amino acid transport substrate-binding protein